MTSIIITGASAGIGASAARAFLDAGWTVGLLARRAEQLKTVAADHPNAVLLPCDVTDEDSVQTAFDTFAYTAGHLDVLFNNAGMFGKAVTIDDMSLEDWRAVMDLNITGMFLAARAAFRQMRAQSPMGGRIINNGSISAHVPRANSIAYTTSKHAITGMTRSLSLDGRAFDIACGQIDIGNARTGLLEDVIAANPDNPPPTMDVKDVSRTLLHMASLPPDANVQFVTLMATKMPFIGRG